ncbi:MAG: hypothetical protein RMK81_06065 [Geminicoccaceae bacterium]|nr:hypothetical protein [Geminicoccaceae bacterium]
MKSLVARLRGLPVLARRLAPQRSTPSTSPTRPPEPRPAATEVQGGVVVVTVLGLGGEALERVLDLVEQQCRGLGRKAVFVTDGDDLAPFRRRKLVVEQVPDAEALAVRLPELPWTLYRERLFGLIGRRWRPSATASFGRKPPEACLAALRER